MAVDTKERVVSDLSASAFEDERLRPMLLAMPCEYAVYELAGKEAKRTAHEADERECAVRVPLRNPPETLVNALKAFELKTGHSRRLLTKCLIRHGNLILASIPGIREAARQRDEIVELSGRNKGLSDIVADLDKERYSFVGTPLERLIEFRGVQWAVSRATELCSGLAVPQGTAVAVSIILSLTTTEHEELAGAAQNLMGEVEHFLRYTGERVFDTEALYRKAMARVAGNTDTNAWRHDVGICWGKPPDDYKRRSLDRAEEVAASV